jgi:hypothetical protein
MKKYGPTRILETKFLYCNTHGETEWVLSGIKNKKWKCCKCTVEYSKKYRIRKKIKAIAYKGGACESCGYNKYIGALDFHHKNPLLKEFLLAGTGISKKWDTLVIELDKCSLLCRNCHLELHAEEHRIRIESTKFPKTDYHKKLIHKINSKKLNKKSSL